MCTCNKDGEMLNLYDTFDCFLKDNHKIMRLYKINKIKNKKI